MMTWFIWAVMLIAQNGCGTWTSRARNSSSIPYHALASFFGNGVYFANLFIGVDKISTAAGPWEIALTVAFYATFTMLGSIASHYLLMHHVEKRFAGVRQVV